jgi:hypothetical protein
VADKPRIVVKGDKDLIKKLKRLGDRGKLRRVLRRATNASAQVIVRSVRNFWPVDTGLSKRSVTKKVIRTKGGYSAIIGVDSNASAEAEGHTHVPSNIDHLVEFGWQTHSGLTVPAVAPLRRGHEAAKSDADATFARKAAEDIEKAATGK